jgi:hypothetical protein
MNFIDLTHMLRDAFENPKIHFALSYLYLHKFIKLNYYNFFPKKEYN